MEMEFHLSLLRKWEPSRQKIEAFDGFYVDQVGSNGLVLGYEPIGFEIAKRLEGKADLLSAAVGTGGALMGTLDGLQKNIRFRMW